ncbi:hypothetical protein SDC9_177768 [bioreactor metagenome]|uniref:Uncharacterized protein n=1 Tax=bioreactor metagenome TaxID=1076179 RepID=A0A645GU58_9ZZZZ
MSNFQIDKDKFVLDILIGAFDGRRTNCAAGIGVSLRLLNRFLDDQAVKNGRRTYKFESAFSEYCKSKEIDPQQYFTTTKIST